MSGLFVLHNSAVDLPFLATGPDEIRVSEANQTLAIIIACHSTVSSDLRSHSVWIFVIISFCTSGVRLGSFVASWNSCVFLHGC